MSVDLGLCREEGMSKDEGVLLSERPGPEKVSRRGVWVATDINKYLQKILVRLLHFPDQNYESNTKALWASPTMDPLMRGQRHGPPTTQQSLYFIGAPCCTAESRMAIR